MLRVLIVDDEIKIREVVAAYCQAMGYSCKQASDGKQAIEMIKQEDFDCVILDIMMPRLDGFSACKQIKELKDVAIIILSARTQEEDKLFFFDLGADDYVTKPFSPKELMARIKAVCERHNIKNNQNYRFDGLYIDVEGRYVTIDDVKVGLTPKEFDLLLYLINNRNVALDREKILSAVWKYDFYGDDRTVDTHIKMLRNHLGKYRDYIVTVRGMGYKFEVQ